jgi:alpha/beta superfamily hydrolase
VIGMRMVCGLTVLFAAITQTACPQQTPRPASSPEGQRQYQGAYRWDDDANFVYLQPWEELTGQNLLTAFDELGDVRALYPLGADSFSAGRAAAVPEPIEARIAFLRQAGQVTALTWERESGTRRTARRVVLDTSEDVTFSNGDVRLAGTLVAPRTAARHVAIILVHASCAEDREYLLPFARFLVRHGIAVLGYDKRGVGASTGDWKTASFDDLAGDVVAAFRFLSGRTDIDSTAIGLLGWSQAGWVMPLAAVQEPRLAFLVSISGASVPVSETTIDQARTACPQTR